MFYNLKEDTLKTKSQEVDYVVFGKGSKPLMMIPGLNTRGVKGSGKMLAWMYRIFAKDFRVYVFDRKKDIPEGYTVREMADDLADAMDALGLKDAAVLGVSQGGMIGQYLAIDRPDLVERMALAVTLSKNNDTVVSAIESWIEMVEGWKFKEFVVDMAEKMYSPAYVKKYRLLMPLLAILQKPKDTARFIRLAKSCLTCQAYDELEKIQCPVLVLGGMEDNIVTGEASTEIAEKLGCESYLYPGLGHAAYEEAAKDFNQRVYDFFIK